MSVLNGRIKSGAHSNSLILDTHTSLASIPSTCPLHFSEGMKEIVKKLLGKNEKTK